MLALTISTVVVLAAGIAYLSFRARQQATTLKEMSAGIAHLKSEIANMRASEAIVVPDVTPTPARKRKPKPKR